MYIDDVLIFSESQEDHIIPMRSLFEALKQVGFIHLSKSEFGKGTVTYLGHEVRCGVVFPRVAKVQAILEFQVPQW